MAHNANLKKAALGCLGLIVLVTIAAASIAILSDGTPPQGRGTEQLSPAEADIKEALAGVRDLPPDHSSQITIALPPEGRPNSSDVTRGALENYRLIRARRMTNVRDVYFAASCHLFESVLATTFLLSETAELQETADADRISDPFLKQDLNAAAQDGVDQSQ